MAIFGPDYNLRATPTDEVLGLQAVVGGLGILGLLALAWWAARSARGSRQGLRQPLGAFVLALVLFVIWVLLAMIAGSS